MGFKREGLRGSKGGVEVVLPQQQAMNDPYSKERIVAPTRKRKEGGGRG